MNPTRRLKAAAVLTCALLATFALAGCGSSGSDDSGNSGLQGDEIVIGYLGQYGGPLASIYGGIPDTLKAWAKQLNDNGGINGQPVKIVTEDLGANPVNGKRYVQDFVEKDKVTAIIDGDPNDSTWLPYAQQHDVPVFLGQGLLGALKSPVAFSANLQLASLAYSWVSTAAKAGSTLGVAYCAETNNCAFFPDLFKQFTAGLHITMPVSLKVSGSAPDYTAVCQQFKEAKVDTVIVIGASTMGTRIFSTCKKQGLNAVPALLGVNAVPDWKTDAAYHGASVDDGTAPYFSNEFPAVAAYRTMLKKYAPKIPGSGLDNSANLGHYAAAQLFLKAAKAGTGKVTGKSVIDGAYTLKNETLDGLVGPLTFTKGNLPTSVNTCHFVWTINDSGGFVPPADQKPDCVDPAILEPALKQLLRG